MAETYIRPPIVAREARSQRAAIWRFRAYLIIVLLALGFGIFLIAKAIVGGGEGSPDVGGTLPVMHVHHTHYLEPDSA
jgi:hypothetical protein